MIQKFSINLWDNAEYDYPEAYGFCPNITGYLHEQEEGKSYPCILVIPGGGYCVVAPQEAEIVALKFYGLGYNAFVLTYTVNLTRMTPLKQRALYDAARAVRLLRFHAKEWGIRENQIVLCGFSAGGHLAGSLCVHYDDVEEKEEKLQKFSCRPDAAILCYPVITTGKWADRPVFSCLLGDEATKEELSYMSLEQHVTSDTPPCFLWHTRTDETVPVENSLLMRDALVQVNIPCECHIFSNGHHGFSLADETYASGNFGTPYTLLQAEYLVKAIKEGKTSLPKEKKEELLNEFDQERKPQDAKPFHDVPNQEVAAWPMLADSWIRALFGNEKNNS